jgi:cation:H+ antiporter
MAALAVTGGLLLACAAVIYLSCEYFTNGVEWLGRAFGFGQTATGAILAAFGTALPETVVTFVAVALGTRAASKAVGVGAAMGGPLALATLAYGVVGAAFIVLGRELPSSAEARTGYRRLAADQAWFLVIFAVKLGLGLVAFAGKALLGWLFLAAYGLWVRAGLAASPDEKEEGGGLQPLRLTPRAAVPTRALILLQTGGALVAIFLASRLFVEQLERLGELLAAPPQLVALFGSPMVTELPETLNAVIWVRQGKHRLALANISGAMMIQATVPAALGLFFTPWRLDPPLVAAGLATIAAVAVLAAAFRWGFASRRVLAGLCAIYPAVVALIFWLKP